MVLLLFESAAGLALFKVLDEGKLKKAETEDLWDDFETLDAAKKVVKLKAFSRFEGTADALASVASLVDSQMSKGLKKFLKKHASGETLAVLDSKLGSVIKEKLDVPCVHGAGVAELTRGVRAQLVGLLGALGGAEGGAATADLRPMALGLAHSLSRYRLRFSPDKVDTMIVQAIGLLDDLDKELNTYAMRLREWYGWHFPEMTKLVADHSAYAKAIAAMGTRDRAADVDFSGIFDEETEAAVKAAAQVSMGTELAEEDVLSIDALGSQVVSLSDYRAQLAEYLRSRMAAVAPNLTALVGELVGARLIAHVGSLINLAKAPASTVQILGAEKALFRALKTKHDTPKYGLIFHASLVGQASAKNKGKISRVLAAKASLGARVDALGDVDDGGAVGLAGRAKVEARLRQLEGRALADDGANARGGLAQPPALDAQRPDGAALAGAARAYSTVADVALPETDAKKEKKKLKKKAEEVEAEEEPKKKKSKKATENGSVKEDKKDKKEKKEKKDKKDKKKSKE